MQNLLSFEKIKDLAREHFFLSFSAFRPPVNCKHQIHPEGGQPSGGR
jgi:hypothetical protein